MAYSHDQDDELLVYDLVDDPVVPDAQPLCSSSRATSAGSPFTRISTRTVAGSGQLTVANTGRSSARRMSGASSSRSQRLSGRTSHDGFGLGLAIVASIAAIHGGTVTARPRDDGGLSVTVTIPSAGATTKINGAQAAERPGVARPA